MPKRPAHPEREAPQQDGERLQPSTLPSSDTGKVKPTLRPPVLTLAIVLAVGALACGAGLLLLDGFADFSTNRFHAVASALPLILIGLSWLALHPGWRVHPIQFLKRLIAAVAFVLWGWDQMLPPGRLASTIGDVVIALFVLDMALIIRGELTEDPND